MYWTKNRKRGIHRLQTWKRKLWKSWLSHFICLCCINWLKCLWYPVQCTSIPWESKFLNKYITTFFLKKSWPTYKCSSVLYNELLKGWGDWEGKQIGLEVTKEASLHLSPPPTLPLSVCWKSAMDMTDEPAHF